MESCLEEMVSELSVMAMELLSAEPNVAAPPPSPSPAAPTELWALRSSEVYKEPTVDAMEVELQMVPPAAVPPASAPAVQLDDEDMSVWEDAPATVALVTNSVAETDTANASQPQRGASADDVDMREDVDEAVVAPVVGGRETPREADAAAAPVASGTAIGSCHTSYARMPPADDELVELQPTD